MDKQVRESIEKANSRGVGQFHVFGDEPFYIANEHVGKCRYQGTWHSLDTARAVAAKKDNGVVFNVDGKNVTKT